MSEREPVRTEDPLFRREAVEEYLRGRDHGRLLNVSPTWSVWAFALLLAVFAGALAYAAFARIGVDVRGQAIVRHAPGGGALEVVCVLPADAPDATRPASRVAVEFGSERPVRLVLRPETSAPQVFSPEAAREALGPEAAAAATIAGPVVLIRAALPANRPAGEVPLPPGTLGTAWVRTGTTTLLRSLAFAKEAP